MTLRRPLVLLTAGVLAAAVTTAAAAQAQPSPNTPQTPLTAEAMAGRFHGNDERIDVESLTLTTQAWLEVCEQFLG